ncbi:Gfo/Idh/MocA family protein [Poriferisphaera sp. WC338]|uniref:Gfo/Idh/MocA family protein n=1 Tax=Poriferisphaera sp. WC338 TaxID=3425129 RepID=UPI003D81BAA9
MKTIRFGIIGCGLMGKEFASAAARWCHLQDMPAKPEIVAICNRSDKPFPWFKQHFSTIKQFTHDYRDILNNDEVDAVYIALPHHLHEETYVAAIKADKHLMGEKPFGIDLEANKNILDCMANHPNVFVRCVSQFPFFPAVQRIGEMIESKAFGQIIEVRSGFLHSSDLNVNKPINWKRQIEFNGEYGVLGDLGMHACHVPIRAGWNIGRVHSILSNLVTSRYQDQSRTNKVPCETWDNASLLIECIDETTSSTFPWELKTQRIAPGEKNSWYIEILGTKQSARYNTANPKQLLLLNSDEANQTWKACQTGFETAYPTITGPIFEFGFTDAILQMWAAFIYELSERTTPNHFSGCVRPEETATSHRIFTEALRPMPMHTTAQ